MYLTCACANCVMRKMERENFALRLICNEIAKNKRGEQI